MRRRRGQKLHCNVNLHNHNPPLRTRASSFPPLVPPAPRASRTRKHKHTNTHTIAGFDANGRRPTASFADGLLSLLRRLKWSCASAAGRIVAIRGDVICGGRAGRDSGRYAWGGTCTSCGMVALEALGAGRRIQIQVSAHRGHCAPLDVEPSGQLG